MRSSDIRSPQTEQQDNATVELAAVVVAVTGDDPRVLTVQRGTELPSGPLQSQHRSLQTGLRAWVESATRHSLGYVEQLYTFADRDRGDEADDRRIISISYLGLTREAATVDGAVTWQGWYRYLPWEDWRNGPPALLNEMILPALQHWIGATPDTETQRDRAQRVELCFAATPGARWNEELVLQRYELLYEAGLVPEAVRRQDACRDIMVPGAVMGHDHRRILATGMARLRAKIKYRPVVFELMPDSFTLLQLQRTIEALAGQRLHKQNLRRLIDQQGLVEETGQISTDTGGRPAKLVRFRREVLQERAVVGSSLPLSRS